MKALISILFIFFVLNVSAEDSAEKIAKMSPEVKEIMAKAKKAAKMDTLADVKSMTQSAELVIANMNIKGTMNIKVAENGILVESKFAGMTETQGYNGKTAWANSLTTGLRTLKDGEKLKLVGETLKYAFNEEKFYDEIKLAGKEEFNGKECYKLELIKEGLDNSYDFYDTKTFMASGTKDTVLTPQGKIQTTTTILSFKEHEKGFLYPDKISQSMGPMTIVIQVSDLKLNPKIDKKVFNPPAQ